MKFKLEYESKNMITETSRHFNVFFLNEIAHDEIKYRYPPRLAFACLPRKHSPVLIFIADADPPRDDVTRAK